MNVTRYMFIGACLALGACDMPDEPSDTTASDRRFDEAGRPSYTSDPSGSGSGGGSTGPSGTTEGPCIGGICPGDPIDTCTYAKDCMVPWCYDKNTLEGVSCDTCGIDGCWVAGYTSQFCPCLSNIGVIPCALCDFGIQDIPCGPLYY